MCDGQAAAVHKTVEYWITQNKGRSRIGVWDFTSGPTGKITERQFAGLLTLAEDAHYECDHQTLLFFFAVVRYQGDRVGVASWAEMRAYWTNLGATFNPFNLLSTYNWQPVPQITVEMRDKIVRAIEDLVGVSVLRRDGSLLVLETANAQAARVRSAVEEALQTLEHSEALWALRAMWGFQQWKIAIQNRPGPAVERILAIRTDGDATPLQELIEWLRHLARMRSELSRSGVVGTSVDATWLGADAKGINLPACLDPETAYPNEVLAKRLLGWLFAARFAARDGDESPVTTALNSEEPSWRFQDGIGLKLFIPDRLRATSNELETGAAALTVNGAVKGRYQFSEGVWMRSGGSPIEVSVSDPRMGVSTELRAPPDYVQAIQAPVLSEALSVYRFDRSQPGPWIACSPDTLPDNDPCLCLISRGNTIVATGDKGPIKCESVAALRNVSYSAWRIPGDIQGRRVEVSRDGSVVGSAQLGGKVAERHSVAIVPDGRGVWAGLRYEGALVYSAPPHLHLPGQTHVSSVRWYPWHSQAGSLGGSMQEIPVARLDSRVLLGSRGPGVYEFTWSTVRGGPKETGRALLLEPADNLMFEYQPGLDAAWKGPRQEDLPGLQVRAVGRGPAVRWERERAGLTEVIDQTDLAKSWTTTEIALGGELILSGAPGSLVLVLVWVAPNLTLPPEVLNTLVLDSDGNAVLNVGRDLQSLRDADEPYSLRLRWVEGTHHGCRQPGYEVELRNAGRITRPKVVPQQPTVGGPIEFDFENCVPSVTQVRVETPLVPEEPASWQLPATWVGNRLHTLLSGVPAGALKIQFLDATGDRVPSIATLRDVQQIGGQPRRRLSERLRINLPNTPDARPTILDLLQHLGVHVPPRSEDGSYAPVREVLHRILQREPALDQALTVRQSAPLVWQIARWRFWMCAHGRLHWLTSDAWEGLGRLVAAMGFDLRLAQQADIGVIVPTLRAADRPRVINRRRENFPVRSQHRDSPLKWDAQQFGRRLLEVTRSARNDFHKVYSTIPHSHRQLLRYSQLCESAHQRLGPALRHADTLAAADPPTAPAAKYRLSARRVADAAALFHLLQTDNEVTNVLLDSWLRLDAPPQMAQLLDALRTDEAFGDCVFYLQSQLK